jgi:class 3 adenylate cyclase
VLVSQAVIDEADGASVLFSEVGSVQLKGVLGPMTLFEASRPV